MSQARMAVVGAGLIGRQHAWIYSQYERCELSVICDIREERAREVAEEFGCDWCTDHRDVADSNVDGVSLVTPDFAHTEPAIALVRAGKHVLFEKPLTTNVAEADQIVREIRDTGVKAMINLPRRWNPQFVAIKQAVDAGEIGQPIMGYARLSDTIHVPLQMLSWAGRSGPHWFLLPHTMDHMRWVLGQEARRVYAAGRRGILADRGVDTIDAMQVMVEFDNAFATFESNWIIPETWPELIEHHFVLYGSDGRIGLDSSAALFGANIATTSQPFSSGGKSVYGDPPAFTVAEVRHFLDSIVDDTTPTGATVEDGFAVVSMIRAAEVSMETGQPVELEDFIRHEVGSVTKPAEQQ